MEFFGQMIIYIIMASAFIGAIASILDNESEIGKAFVEGINSIGAIFLPVAGIMAASPYITVIVENIFGNIFSFFGADSAMAATTFIAVDMGGYQLAQKLALCKENWILAMIVGYMAGATIVFSIPVALKMISVKDRAYLAIGSMIGFITIPFGVLIASLLIYIEKPMVRGIISSNADLDYQLTFNLNSIFINILPLFLICFIIAAGLYYIPQKMIECFVLFGKIMEACLKIIFVASVIEYFTGLFSYIFGSWNFAPIIADKDDINRALEVSGYIGIMLCGAFPLIYIIKKYANRYLMMIGKKFGLSVDATTGILAASANILALFAIIKDMNNNDKIKTIAFAIPSAFLIGDHLAFTANFQPSLILPIMIGKCSAGVLGIILANKFIKYNNINDTEN